MGTLTNASLRLELKLKTCDLPAKTLYSILCTLCWQDANSFAIIARSESGVTGSADPYHMLLPAMPDGKRG
eukprot:2366862-Pleurochrysis_carterae.AAC.1